MSSSVRRLGDRRQRWLDGFAVAASLLCLIHCLVLPALLVALPVVATMLVVPESFHAVAFVVALPTSLLAMLSGMRRHDRRWPMAIAAIGLALLGIGAFAIDTEAAERAVSTLGAVLLAVAHVINWRAMSHRPDRPVPCPAERAE